MNCDDSLTVTTLDAAQSQDVHLENSIENDLLSFGLKKEEPYFLSLQQSIEFRIIVLGDRWPIEIAHTCYVIFKCIDITKTWSHTKILKKPIDTPGLVIMYPRDEEQKNRYLGTIVISKEVSIEFRSDTPNIR